jgi:multidrug resistance efflux pump
MKRPQVHIWTIIYLFLNTIPLLLLCLWAMRDAWFPTEKILSKHPQEFPVTVSVSGVIEDIPVKIGEEVSDSTPLIKLHSRRYEEAVTAAKEAYALAKRGNEEQAHSALDSLVMAKEDLSRTTVRGSDFTLKTSHGDEPLHGTVLETMVSPASFVEAGDVVMLVEPADTFYVFNKTLTLLSGILAALATIPAWIVIFGKNKSWVWMTTLIFIALGIPNNLLLGIPVLIFWIKNNNKEYYGKLK